MKNVVLELARRDFVQVTQAFVEYAQRQSKRKLRNERESERAMRLADIDQLRNRLLEIFQSLPKND